MGPLPELLNPAQVCHILGIAPKNISRLTSGGYLEVKGKIQFNNGMMHLFPSHQVKDLIPQMPRIKQSWERLDNYKHGAHRQTRKKQHRQTSYHNTIKRKEQFFQDISSFPDQTELLLKTCYYLYHLNHYAKAENTWLYDLKDLVLRTIIQNYPDEVTARFIEGDNKTLLCPECRAKAERRHLSHVQYLDKTGGCPLCTREYKYYSLFEFVISYRDYTFCFHTPYARSKKWFNKASLPPKKDIADREGAYAFGRAIYDSEALAVELLEVIEELQQFLLSFNVEPLIKT